MKITVLLLLGSSVLGATPAHADAPLATVLQLNAEQTQEVKQIQASHRSQFRAARGDYNRLSRALRRARKSADTDQVTELEASTTALRSELQQIRSTEDAQIRSVLRPEQVADYEDYIRQRQAMVGSSRDEGILR